MKTILDTSHGWPRDFSWAEGGLSCRISPVAGGLGDGLALLDICSGPLRFSLLPGRGMGIWKGTCDGYSLGWESPVQGPVHPCHVELERRGGLGWLDGFDELLCRCGLAFNGPPGKDANGYPITLHGRIANLPASSLRILHDKTHHRLIVEGVVLESSVFDSRLKLTTTYSLLSGSRVLSIWDRVENGASHAAEMQLLYHLNIGRPFLEKGSTLHLPIKSMSPQTEKAAEAIGGWQTYQGPQAGFKEEVYLFHLRGNAKGQGQALLAHPEGKLGVAVRFPLRDLPCFTVWKQTGALEDAFVTGLEPATGFPNFKDFERENGRVVCLEAGAIWEASWEIEVVTQSERLSEIKCDVEALSGSPTIHSKPHKEFTPHGS